MNLDQRQHSLGSLGLDDLEKPLTKRIRLEDLEDEEEAGQDFLNEMDWRNTMQYTYNHLNVDIYLFSLSIYFQYLDVPRCIKYIIITLSHLNRTNAISEDSI